MRTGGEDDSLVKFWAWDKKNLPSITHAIRAAVAATASVIIARLVQMPEAYWAAIVDFGRHAIHARRDTDAVDRANRRHRCGCISWSTRGELLRSKSGRVRGCDFSRRIAAHRVSFGEDVYRYASITLTHHCSNSALSCPVDSCFE